MRIFMRQKTEIFSEKRNEKANEKLKSREKAFWLTTKKEVNQMNYYEQTVSEVREDFETRKKLRREKELAWQLNMNFLYGNQYCRITPEKLLRTSEKTFFWQHREVFNHIAPVMETRSAKLLGTRPKIRILPLSGEGDGFTKTAEKAVNSVFERAGMQKIIAEATSWSEVTGTVFYKITADSDGNAEISVCPPFEIYPDSFERSDVEDCRSIIHARALPVGEIKRIWNEEVGPEKLSAFNPAAANNPELSGCATVIEKYEKPSENFPEGRLVIVAGDKLLYSGGLPYSEGGRFSFPFVRQVSLPVAGSFYGASVIERLIPLQRAYNDVKNRKHELLSRLAGGILTVEEGSVNVDELEEDGLYPGKILVYRQGASVPSFMQADKLPSDFISEEERILREFSVISGVSDLMRSNAPVRVTSGTALNLLLEQDGTRISVSSDGIARAVKETAEKVLEIMRIYGYTDGDGSLTDESGNLSRRDFTVITEKEGNSAPVRMMSIALEIFESGLLCGENGKVPTETRNKLLEMMGLGSLIQ